MCAAVGQFVDVAYPGTPTDAPIAALPLRLSDTHHRALERPPTSASTTDEVLTEAGLNPAELEALRAASLL